MECDPRFIFLLCAVVLIVVENNKEIVEQSNGQLPYSFIGSAAAAARFAILEYIFSAPVSSNLVRRLVP
jgi:hypothetical protein